MEQRPLRFALIAHDARKQNLVDWVTEHADFLRKVEIFATGTTGSRLQEALPELNVTRFKSGPLGGDQQIGAMISEERLDALIFFIDPLSPLPHDVDVKALTRLAIVYDLPMANSQATADCIVFAFAERGADLVGVV